MNDAPSARGPVGTARLESVAKTRVETAAPELLASALLPADEASQFETTRDRDYRAYRKVLAIILGWVLLAVFVMFVVNINVAPSRTNLWEDPTYTGRYGYTWSLLFVLLPLVYLLVWYRRNEAELQLQHLFRVVLTKVSVTGGMWILLDILLANKFFKFPDPHAHMLPMFFGYPWEGNCTTIWTLFNFSACYPRNIPLEEFIFYLGSGTLLTMMYMWANEDFLNRHAVPRPIYTTLAQNTRPLIDWNRTLIFSGVALAIAGVMIKKFGPQVGLHQHSDGFPYYFLAQLAFVFIPLSALYNRVRLFTNPQAFLFVMELQLLLSLIWESTLAVPYGWWGYREPAMMGVTVTAWTYLPIEAVILWLAVGWTSMFIYEAGKIKLLSGKTWREILWG